MEYSKLIKNLQSAMNLLGEKLSVDGDAGPATRSALKKYDVTLTAKKISEEVAAPVLPKYPATNKFHPKFDVPAPYTHLHPYDVLRSVQGEKEIYGEKDNPLIAHFHEHSGNLGKHTEGAKFHDEVPHCSSALNWAADMSGCRKTDSALAASWDKYNHPREGDWVEVGDIVRIAHPGGHVTLCAERFNRKLAKTFKGFGSNQGNTIKTSTYSVRDIKSINSWDPLKGTMLAPVGLLGYKPESLPVGGLGESTT